jgi:type III restriction enzyme
MGASPKLVNDIRRRVALWRKGGYVSVTSTTARLIAYWTDPNREKKLFFCQNEALETAIYIAEVAKKYGDSWVENATREANDTSNPGCLEQRLRWPPAPARPSSWRC